MKLAFLCLFIISATICSLAENRVGIQDIDAKQGVSDEDASILTDFVYDAAFRLVKDRYEIINRQARAQLLEEHRFTLGGLADSVESTVEVGKLLAADLMIIGSFTKFGSKYYVSLQLVNVATSTIEGSARYGADDYDGIEKSVDNCVNELFGLPHDGPITSILTDDSKTLANEPTAPLPGNALWKGIFAFSEGSDDRKTENIQIGDSQYMLTLARNRPRLLSDEYGEIHMSFYSHGVEADGPSSCEIMTYSNLDGEEKMLPLIYRKTVTLGGFDILVEQIYASGIRINDDRHFEVTVFK